MRRFLGFGVLASAPFAVIVVLGAQYAQPTPPGQPAWAYGIPPAAPPGAVMPTPPAESKDTTMHKVPGSDKAFTQAQISNPFGPADWFPGDHPPMPDIVAKGRMAPGKTANESARACGLCHYPNGKGRSENSSVSGLPVSYFIQQMNDFRNDTRKSSEPRKANAIVMVNIAKAMTEQEIKEAAEYFAAIKWTTPYIRVVESNTVPKTRVTAGVHHILEGAAAGTEPIGQRIIESPGAQRALRAPRPARRLGGVCPGRQHQEGRSAGQDGRKREDGGLRQLPWRRPAGPRPGAPHCRSFSQHAGAPDVGHEAGHPSGHVGRPDEAGRAQPDQ